MIRELQEVDVDNVVRIWLASSIAAHKFVPRSFWESKVSEIKEVYLPKATSYVYVQDGIVCGFISLVEDNIAALFVAPEFQGNGFGSALINYVKSFKNNLSLNVYEKNLQSIKFYKSHGFVTSSKQIEEKTGEYELAMSYQH